MINGRPDQHDSEEKPSERVAKVAVVSSRKGHPEIRSSSRRIIISLSAAYFACQAYQRPPGRSWAVAGLVSGHYSNAGGSLIDSSATNKSVAIQGKSEDKRRRRPLAITDSVFRQVSSVVRSAHRVQIRDQATKEQNLCASR